MVTKLFLSFGCLLIALQLQAQHRISGAVQNEEGKAIANAQVLLLKGADSVLLRSALSDEGGQFALTEIPAGAYLLRFAKEGFTETAGLPLTMEASDLEIPAQRLVAEKELGEAVVTGKKLFIEVRADKLIVNVENSIVAAGSSALEVLGRSPGVMVDQNDNISLRGRPGVAIWIDGRPVPMAGADLASVLRGMPAASVERIEIIANPGARYDASGTAGIINIITKKDKRMGANGSANASFGQGFYPATSAGINGNYRNRKVNVYAGYNYSLRGGFNDLNLQRRFYDGGNLLYAYDQENYTKFYVQSHVVNAGADYAIGKKTSVGVGLTGSRTGYDPEADNVSRTLGSGGETLYFFKTTGRHQNDLGNYSINLNLRHRIDSLGGELNMDADYLRFDGRSAQLFRTDYFLPNGTRYLVPYILSSDLQGLTQIRTVKLDYIRPLKNGLRLEAGVKGGYVTADNNSLYYDESSGGVIYDSTRSNHFLYDENINAAYVNAARDAAKWSFQIGLRMENTNATGRQQMTGGNFERHYTQLFPSLAGQYHLNKNNDLGLSLSRRIERPNYQQLNPFKYFIDKTTYREGYPYLNPALSYNIELSHTFMQRLVTTATYSETEDVIIEVIQPSDNDDSVTVQTNKNLERLRYFAVSGAYSFPITKWWNNVTSFDAYYSRYEGNVANTPLSRTAPAFNLNTTNSFALPKDWSAEIGLYYQSQMLYGFLEMRPLWMLNAGVQKSFLQRRATVRLNITDVFWKGWPRGTSSYRNYEEYFEARRETRKATIAFTWRFGRTTVAPVRRRNGGAEEEKRRVGDG